MLRVLGGSKSLEQHGLHHVARVAFVPIHFVGDLVDVIRRRQLVNTLRWRLPWRAMALSYEDVVDLLRLAADLVHLRVPARLPLFGRSVLLFFLFFS